MLSVGIGLGICAVWDWRRRELPVWLLMAFQTLALGAAIFCSEETFESRIAALGIGILFFLFSKITDQAIGYADSWIILSLGIYLGIEKLLLVLFAASFAAAITSLVILWIRKWNRKDTIPFIPFLILGYAGDDFSMRKKVQGSFTIEASVIVPLIMVVFAIIMQMLFYYHDKNILLATASECVAIGSDENTFLQMIDGKMLLLTDITVEVENCDEQSSLFCTASHGRMVLQLERHMIQTEPERYIREILKRKEQIGK